MKKRKRIEWRQKFCCLTWLVVNLLTVSALWAANLEVQVKAPDGAVVATAEVHLVCSNGETVELDMRADRPGYFIFSSVEGESCEMLVTAPGFEPYRQNKTFSDGDQVLQVELRLAPVRGSVLVTSSLPELATEQRVSSNEVIDAGEEDLAEFFRNRAGTSALRRGGINLEPGVRGLQEDQVGTFVDGTRTFAAGPARMDSNISHINPHATQSLRIVKGPYALAWGSGTLSAIAVDTWRPDFSTAGTRWNGSLTANYGENAESTDTFGSVWGGGEKYRLYLGVGHRDGSDYEAGDGSLVQADYGSTEVRWHFGLRPQENLLLEYSGGYQEQQDLDYPGRLLDATYFYARSHDLELNWNPQGRVSVEAQLYSNRKDHLMNNNNKPTARGMPGRIPPFAIEVVLPTEANTTGGRFRLNLAGGDLDWSFGLDYYRLEQTASRTISRRSNGLVLFQDIVWPDAEIENLGGYGQLILHRDGYQIGATVRLDEVDAQATRLSPFFLANTTGDPDQSETDVSVAVSGVFVLSDRWSMDLGIGRAVRTASVLERYSDRFPATKFQLAAEFMGNPELEAEQSLELDFGLTGRFDSLQVQFSAFYRVIDDYITVVADPTLPRRLPLSPPTVYRYINGSEATFYGGELMLNQQLGDHFVWRGSLGYIWAEEEDPGEPVLGIRPLNGEIGLRYYGPKQRFWLDAAARFTDRQDRVAASRFERETPGATVIGLGGFLRLNKLWALRLQVESLTDRAYADHLNSPNPFTGQRILEIGRNVRAGFEVTF